MKRPHRPTIAALLVLGLALGPAAAQQSASFKLEESVLNAGGHPDNGTSPASAAFRMSLDAVGDGVAGRALSSASFRLDSGFVPAFPPPGEVTGLLFADPDTLTWNPEKSAGTYTLYRDLLGSLSGLGYGTCLTTDIVGTTTDDPAVPAAATGWFYLVNARNRIDEEGTKGFGSGGGERPNPAPCP